MKVSSALAGVVVRNLENSIVAIHNPASGG